jgi:hypothetical protein
LAEPHLLDDHALADCLEGDRLSRFGDQVTLSGDVGGTVGMRYLMPASSELTTQLRLKRVTAVVVD